MRNHEFVVWLWGYLELCPPQPITKKMLYIIRNHMNLVIAVDKEFIDLNKQIHHRISIELTRDIMSDDTVLFHDLKSMIASTLNHRKT